MLLFLVLFKINYAQSLIYHTTNYFGPNANPVPEFSDASIPKYTEFSTAADYYYGYGDQTISNISKLEIPLIAEKVSVKAWAVVLEHFSVSDQVLSRRQMQKNEGFATGDLYIQLRIKLLSEDKLRPAIILNSTLKTASGSEFKNRRFFNTAGYYFDIEIGKSIKISNFFIDEMRVVSNLGFFSWDIQTPNLNVQDDAILYGGKLILKHKNISLENTFSGYNGWVNRVEDYGNRPIVFASKLNLHRRKAVWFAQYQHGIRHFPYKQIRVGIQFSLQKLTPDFLENNLDKNNSLLFYF